MYKTTKSIGDYSYKNINDIDHKRIVIRSGLNVVTNEDGKMVDSSRFYESLPLIQEMALNAENVVVLGHLGRPENKENKFSFKNIAEQLQIELSKYNVKVELITELSEENISKINSNKNSSNDKKVFLIENIRFFDGEENKNASQRENFAKLLSSLGNVFINDAFADYRESASTYDIAKFSHEKYLGPVFSREITELLKLSSPKKPFVAILGGAKLSEKLDALKALAEIADKVIVGGAMAYTLMKTQGINIGNSRFEEDKLEVAKEIMSKFGDKILLPSDHLVAEFFNIDANYEYTESADIDNNKIAIDIGWKTINRFKEEIQNAKTILWNGPMGVFEWNQSEVGTKEIGIAITNNVNAYKIVGGGDSIAAINKFGLNNFNHISTGGGAMLAFLAYDKFPILDVILGE